MPSLIFLCRSQPSIGLRHWTTRMAMPCPVAPPLALDRILFYRSSWSSSKLMSCPTRYQTLLTAPLRRTCYKTSSQLTWPLTRRYGTTLKTNIWWFFCFCPLKCPINSFFVCSAPTSCFAGAALLCILWGGYPVFPQRGVPRASRGHLLLPGGWQHVHYWTHGGELWHTAGKTDQTAASAQEWTWRSLPVERPQPWHGPGGVWSQVPHHIMWRFYKGTTTLPIWLLS